MRLSMAAALAALALGGCAAGGDGGGSSGLTPTSSTGSAPPAGHCRARGPLPDARCTPGALGPHVDQADVRSTICRAGFTRRIRPPVSYTDSLKRRQLAAYGWYAGHSPSGYEEDHLVPLELGGAPSDPRNLWPEARTGSDGSAAQKDVLENYLHDAVCSGSMTLHDAQQTIERNWQAAYLETTG